MTQRGANYPRKKLDHYQTPKEVTKTLLKHVDLGTSIFDPACGKRNLIVNAAREMGLEAYGRDIVTGHDFLTHKYQLAEGVSIVTNPPYGDRRGTLALEFVERALILTKKYKSKVAMLLPVDFDSGKTRQNVFSHPAFALKLVLLDRVKWFNNQSGSTNHAWYVWSWKHRGPPMIRYARIVE